MRRLPVHNKVRRTVNRRLLKPAQFLLATVVLVFIYRSRRNAAIRPIDLGEGSSRLVGYDDLVSRFPSATAARKSLPGYLRGVHVFSVDCPLTFWEAFEEEKFKQQLADAVRDGFNVAILVVPWAGFQVNAHGKLYDPWMYDRLRIALELIRDSGMYSVSRIGYGHNYRPDNFPPDDERCMLFFLEEKKARPAWSEYVRSLQVLFSSYGTHLFNFMSWEDFFCGSDMMRLPKELRKVYGEKSGFGGLIPANDGSDPSDLVHAWYDHVSSFWTTILAYGQEEMPNLTMEVRVDSDPVFEGKDSVLWHGYSNAGTVPGGAWVCTYFAAHFGQSSTGIGITAESAIENLQYMLTEVARNRFGQEKTFLEQFNFIDNTAAAMASTNYLDETEAARFLVQAAPLLRNSTSGYALWAYRNYRQSHLYNGNFLQGRLGWNVTGGSAMHRSGPFVRLQGPIEVTSHARRLPDGVCDGDGRMRHVCFESYTDSGLDAEIASAIRVCLNRRCVHHFPPPHHASESCYSFESNGSEVFQVSFEVETPASSIFIRHVQLWCHEQDLKVRRADGSPGALLGSLRHLNTEL